MLRMNKKGILPMLVLVFTILCLGAFLYFSSEIVGNQKEVMGNGAIGLMQLDFNSKSDAIHDEQLIKQKFSERFVKLAEQGFVKQAKTDDGYSYWRRDSIECYPNLEIVKVNLADSLKSGLKGNYNFDFNMDRSKIVLNLVNSKEYSKKIEKFDIKITPVNSFSVSYNYDIDKVMNNIWKVERIANLCGDDRNCWSNNADFVWKREDKVYKVELVSDKIVDAFGEKEVILKAAIDFEELNPLVGEVFECQS